jgi:4-hydroxy-tetrahydrodipicolinate synthase
MPEIRGVLPIVHTPFGADDQIDWQSLEREIDWAFQSGADGCCTGMVSELLRLSDQERCQLTERLPQLVSGRGVVVASVGAEDIDQTVENARQAEAAGCDAVMAIPPTGGDLSDQQTRAFFVALASSIEIPLIVQDASAYVGRAIDLQVYVQLLDQFGPERIFFKPEAMPLGTNLSRLRDATQGKARVFEGSGGISLIDSFRRGIAGTMPGMEFLPTIVAIWKALHADDDETAYRLYWPLCALVAIQLQAGLDGFLAIEKYVMVKQGLFSTPIRRGPLTWEMDPETEAEVDRLLVRLQDALDDD